MARRVNIRTMQMQDTIDRQYRAVRKIIFAVADNKNSVLAVREILKGLNLSGVDICDEILAGHERLSEELTVPPP